MSVKAKSRHCIKSGWLKKQGGVVKNWKDRFFIIKGGYMLYFNKEEDTKPLGTIELLGNKVVALPYNNDEPGKYLFEISPGDGQAKMTSSHVTFPLMAETDQERKDWIKAIRRVMYASVGGAIFGQGLRETMQFELRQGPRQVPQIVEHCADFILKHGLHTEGIFRLPGRTSLIQQIRERYDLGQRPDLEELGVDLHTVCSVLKLYLRELPQPLIPYDYYEKFNQVALRDIHENEDKAFNDLSDLLAKIPYHNYNVLKYVCKFLYRITEDSEENKMNAVNLGTIFNISVIAPSVDDPTLLMGTSPALTQITALFIIHCDRLFKLEYNTNGESMVVGNLLDMQIRESVEQNQVPPLTPSTVKILTGFNMSSEEAAEMMNNGSDILDKEDTISEDSSSSDRNSTNSELAELDPIAYIARLEKQIGDLKKEVKTVKKENKAQKTKYENHIQHLAKKLSDERDATADAVGRIIDLQSKLQEYQLQHGPMG